MLKELLSPKVLQETLYLHDFNYHGRIIYDHGSISMGTNFGHHSKNVCPQGKNLPMF